MDMTIYKRRLLDRITEPAYLEGLAERPVEQLRAMRAECATAENELSFERRLCQARIDIIEAELARRTGGGGDLVAQLPRILAGEMAEQTGPLPQRAPDLSVPRNADVPRRRVEEIAGEHILGRLPNMSDDELRQVVESLRSHERSISASRRRVHEVIDALQAELVRRYQSGEADPSAALR